MFYRRFCIGLNDKGKLIPSTDSITQHGATLGNAFKDYYVSVYLYNEQQYREFQNTESVAGIFDVVTDKLVFDFDDSDLNKARIDAVSICNRLRNLHEFKESDLRIFFSGNKGFHVEVLLDSNIDVKQFKAITQTIANGLETYDIKISNPSRILRAIGSVHKETGLFKVPLTPQELSKLSIDEIKAIAQRFNPSKEKFPWTVATLSPKVFALAVTKKEAPKVYSLEVNDVDFINKVKGWSNCKWALTQGIEVKPSDRHEKLLCVAATAKALKNTREQSYYFVKNAMKLGVKRYGGEECDKEDLSLIVNSVYSNQWQGGTFSCRDGKTSWLTSLCNNLGPNKCKHNEDESCFIEIDDFASKFANFATNIKENTLKLGVKPIDDNVMLTTSMLVGLLGAPSSGKSTLLFNFLEQSNKDNIDSVFFSMDMSLPLVYLRLIQKHFGIHKDKVFEMFLNNPKEVTRIIETIKEKYKRTKFSFKTGLTVEGMKNAIMDHQDKTGRKVKMVGVDYLECVQSQFSDSTAASGLIANQLKDVANDLETNVMLLLQTQKQSGDPSDPLLSMRNVKGSSVIEQACSVILSLSRPGFSPLTPENDRFVTISSVKDRMGSLVSIDCNWDGLTGRIYELADEDRQLLADIRARKAQEKMAKESW